MESKQFTFRTKTMVNILKPIVDKVGEIDSFKVTENVYSELEAKYICHVMEELHMDLSQLPKFREMEQLEKFKLELQAALDNFCATLEFMQSRVENKSSVTATQVQTVVRNVLEPLFEILVLEDNLINQKIQDSLSKCQSALFNIKADKSTNVIITFKEFVVEVLDCKKLLNTRAHSLVSQKHRNLIFLCISQIQKCIPLMLKNFDTGRLNSIITFKESIRYLSSRLQWCFSELLNLTFASVPKENEEKEECGGQFVHRMDLVLEMLASIKVEDELKDTIPQVKDVVEELLCHAMAIAQVSIASDSANINISCQKVLHAFESVKKECALHTINPSVRQLYCYFLADALESLEQHVNNALLRLVLEVFCEPYAPLKKLVQVACDISVAERCAENLADFICVLDLHVDRIMQIGMFAMACSGDMRRILGIRSCLASLESLEPELVPALTAYYMENDQSSCRNHLKMLTNHWQLEVLELEKLIDGIVDPAAFCQIILEEVHKMVATLKISLNKDKIFLKTLVLGICNRSSKLVKHLNVSTREIEPFTTKLNIPGLIEDLYHACEECSAVAKVSFSEIKSDDPFMHYSRLLKRCKLIVSLMKKLQPLLLELMNQSHSLEATEDNKSASLNIFNKQGDSLFFPENIQDLPLDISDSSSKWGNTFSDVITMRNFKLSDIQFDNEMALLEYQEKGRKLRQERSILYQTPKSVKKSHMSQNQVYRTVTCRSNRRLFSRDDSITVDVCAETSLSHSLVNDTLGLEITDILDNLTSLSSTLTNLNVSDGEY